MRLAFCTWPEVRSYLATNRGILLPVGSTEQHGPMGLIGTDTLCAEAIADRAADRAGALVAPSLAYTPAPFNTGFPGTVSVSAATFTALAHDVLAGLHAQGFSIYILNGHGANLAPLRSVADTLPETAIRIRSWWDFAGVNDLRAEFYGDWEGMHATPSEVAITQALHRAAPPGAAESPPRKLDAAYIAAHSGDRHGPPDQHRRDFPDGRVGSHSALARPAQGRALLAAAAKAVAEDYREFAT